MQFPHNINIQIPAFVFTVFQTPVASLSFTDWQIAHASTSAEANICFKRAVLCLFNSLIAIVICSISDLIYDIHHRRKVFVAYNWNAQRTTHTYLLVTCMDFQG
jgi:hypothetical protein